MFLVENELLTAARLGDLDTIKELMKSGVEIDINGQDSWEVLHNATMNGHLDCLEFFVEQGADVHMTDERTGMSLLHSAAYNGHLDCVQFLVEQGIDVNVKDDDGETPLHWAIDDCHSDCASFLIECGADITMKDYDGYTAFHCAAYAGDLNTLRYLVALVDDIDERDEEGQTALHIASYHNHSDCVKLLIAQGADVRAKDAKGNNALDLAMLNSDVYKALNKALQPILKTDLEQMLASFSVEDKIDPTKNSKLLQTAMFIGSLADLFQDDRMTRANMCKLYQQVKPVLQQAEINEQKEAAFALTDLLKNETMKTGEQYRACKQIIAKLSTPKTTAQRKEILTLIRAHKLAHTK